MARGNCSLFPMKIGIIGIGAMGCLWATRLAGLVELFLVGQWPEQIAAIRADGLTLIPIPAIGGQQTWPIPIFSPQETLPRANVALVLVKSGQTATAAALLPSILLPHGFALTLQNGLGNRETLAQTLGPERVLAGSTAQSAVILQPGIVQHTGNGLTYLQDDARLRPLAHLFNLAGMETQLLPHLESLVWGKLIVNAGINPLTALLRQPNGFLAENPTARLLLERVVLEAAQVAQAQGILLPYPDPVARTLEVARTTAQNYSSMLQDVLRGAPTEIEAITGAILRYGHSHHLITPLNAHLYHLIQAGARPQTVQELAHLLSIKLT